MFSCYALLTLLLLCGRRELLNMQNWTELVRARALQPISIEQAQRGVLVQQYNLHLMDTARLVGKVKWSWD